MASPAPDGRDRVSIPAACRERFLPTGTAAWEILERRGLNSSGMSHLKPGYEILRNRPHFHLVLFTLSGAGALELPGVKGPVAPGSRLTIPAGTPCRYGVTSGHWNIRWFHFTPGLGDWAVRGVAPGLSPSGFGPDLDSAMAGFFAESGRSDGGALEAASLQARLLINLLEREIRPGADGGQTQQRLLFDRLWQAVQEAPEKPWTVTDLARGTGLSVTHFRRRIQELYGAAPQEMVARTRMQCARDLIHAGIGPFRAVAERVGYGNEFAFSTAFRRESGLSPRAWRDRDRARLGGDTPVAPRKRVD